MKREMKITDEEYEKLYRKLEYRFKNSNDPLVDKIKNKNKLSNDDLKLLIRKLEYTFRKSDSELMKKLSDATEEPVVKFSSLSAKKKKDERDKLKIVKKLKDF